MHATHPEIAQLLSLLDQGFDRRAWHGPNLRGSIRGLTAAQAAWRPHPKRHSIADIVAHTAYWKYAIRRKLRGDQRGSFTLKGSNWFALPNPLSEADWRGLVRLLTDEHQVLREAVAEFDPDDLHRPAAGSKYTPATLIQGVAAHDVYHAGQVQLLKRLQIA
jgi:uncharacterized damage-inducible protein DinB